MKSPQIVPTTSYMSPSGYRLRAPVPAAIAAVLVSTITGAIAVGLLDDRVTAGPSHAVALLAGAALLALVAGGKRVGVPWTWIALGSGALAVGLATTGDRYGGGLQTAPLVASAGFLLMWVGIWMIRQQRVRYGQVEFILDATGSLLTISILGVLITLLGYGPYRDAAELWHTLGVCTAVALMSAVPLMTAVGGTPFCARDRWLTVAFAAGLAGHVLITLALRRDLPLTSAGLAVAELQLPLLAIAAMTRPGMAGTKRLGTWWEWVPPTGWAVVGTGTLLADHWATIPLPVTIGAVLALAFAVLRFAYTVRVVGQTVVERHESLTA